MKVPAADLGLYEWIGSTIEYHRTQIRAHLGYRVCSVADADKLTEWLAVSVAYAERNPDRVRDELLVQCRRERIEPPAPARVMRIVRSALHTAEVSWFTRIAARIDPAARARLLALAGAAEGDDVGHPGGIEPELGHEAEDVEAEDVDSVLALIKAMPGNVSLESMLTEIGKLKAIRALGLPRRLFADVAPKVLAGWKARAMVESPSHLRRRAASSPEGAVTLLAALVAEREREVTDNLVDLLIATVHRIGARAERKVTEELINAFKRVSGKENLLFTIADAALAEPDGTVPCGLPGGTGRGVQDQGADLPAHGADHVEGLLHQPLPARADRAGRGAGVRLDQQRAPAGDRSLGAGAALRQGGQHHLLPARRERAGASRHARRLVDDRQHDPPADRHRHHDLATGHATGPCGVNQPMVPDELLRHLTEREQDACAEIDRLRDAIAGLSTLLEDASNWYPVSSSPGRPCWRSPGNHTNRTKATPPAPMNHSRPLTRKSWPSSPAPDGGLRAKDLCRALNIGDQSRHIEGMRSKLKRLVGRDILTEPQPGLFTINRYKN
jgi:hypothetical protein